MRLIDAEALYKHMKKALKLKPQMLGTMYEFFQFVALDCVETAPTIEAKPVVHAHWEGKPLAGYATVRCSACNSCFSENNGRWKYCPDCGAQMDEVTE